MDVSGRVRGNAVATGTGRARLDHGPAPAGRVDRDDPAATPTATYARDEGYQEMSSRMSSIPRAAWAALAAVAVFFSGAQARAQGWGTIKGQVVFDGKDVPANEKATVDKDMAHCLSKGPILKNALIVNEKTKGVRWVLVWITDPKPVTPATVKFVPPIHPSLANPPKTVEIDQP